MVYGTIRTIFTSTLYILFWKDEKIKIRCITDTSWPMIKIWLERATNTSYLFLKKTNVEQYNRFEWSTMMCHGKTRNKLTYAEFLNSSNCIETIKCGYVYCWSYNYIQVIKVNNYMVRSYSDVFVVTNITTRRTSKA